ncbi:MAG: methyltransferase [Synergistaceae bacterium]|jgi:tRNA1(Val) A37 N6-methylase TrmN6|nr:methyltransferase [Synergistaceae bacterium]
MMPAPDDILYGAVKLHQPSEGRGPRVSVDTVLLAHFAKIRSRARVAEMGCAHGAVTLIMAKRNPAASFDGFDIDPGLVDMASLNARLNGLSERARFFVSDLREHRNNFAPESYDAVVMNPPYDEPDKSRPSPSRALAVAMHGEACLLADVVACAKYLLRNGGKFFLVIRAKRMGELFHLLHEHNVKPKRFRAVHPKPDRAASVVLVEAVRASGDGVTAEPPMFIYGEDGEYTENLLEAYRLGGEER